ncbi:hypothetical protein [Aminipila butyrica]|nr:hypothetical protein [Aminipila butyrica]
MRKHHIRKNKCTVCGSNYNNVAFMGGYICEDCIGYIRSPQT